jgi:hypothetical protein
MRWSNALFILSILVAPAKAEPLLAPYKDELFAYPSIVESGFGGDLISVPFDYDRDVLARDEKPDERTRPDYVSLELLGEPSKLVLRRSGETVRYVGVGRTDGNAAVVVIFLHGLGATHHDAMNDWRSGGNLNRIKNLMVRNGGAYLSIDYSGSRNRAKREVAALVDAYAENSPGAPIILACASMGARTCWDLAADESMAPRISGMLMIAAVGRSNLAASLAARPPAGRIPIYIAHGNSDSRVSERPHIRLFNDIKAKAADYPIRLVIFDDGIHRTPLRMVDWRLAINWMIEMRPR